VWWFTPIIPATQEAELRGLKPEVHPGKNMRPYLKNNKSKKRTGSMA
jgi:hypothetical protein